MKVLDLFCGQGGAGAGYIANGFDVIGIDTNANALRRYPGASHCMDWREGLERYGPSADLIHASPPCQRYSGSVTHANRAKFPDLVPSVASALISTGQPYVIENVPGAPLKWYVELCGCMFDLTITLEFGTFALLRKRLFQCSFPVRVPQHKPHRYPAMSIIGCNVPSGFRRKYGKVTTRQRCELMRCEWMTGAGVSESIPPVYTEFIGQAFRDSIVMREAEAFRDSLVTRQAA